MFDGDQLPLSKRGQSPQFLAHVYCGQTAGWIKMPLGIEVGLSPGDFVLDGDPAPLPKRGQSRPQFSAHFYCGQTAGCIKMPLGMEVGLTWGLCVRWRPASPPKKGAEPPIFGPCLLRPNGWMHHDATWYGGRPHLGTLCSMETSFPCQKGGRAPNFWPMSIAAKRLDGSRCHLV